MTRLRMSVQDVSRADVTPPSRTGVDRDMFMEIDAIANIDEIPSGKQPEIYPPRDADAEVDRAEYVLVEIERRSGKSSQVYMTRETYVAFTKAYMAAHGSAVIHN